MGISDANQQTITRYVGPITAQDHCKRYIQSMTPTDTSQGQRIFRKNLTFSQNFSNFVKFSPKTSIFPKNLPPPFTKPRKPMFSPIFSNPQLHKYAKKCKKCKFWPRPNMQKMQKICRCIFCPSACKNHRTIKTKLRQTRSGSGR